MTAATSAPAARLVSARQALPPAALELACHAAVPVAVDPGFLNLLRVNFFTDPPWDLPDTVDAVLLTSPLFREIGGGLYEIDESLRRSLLVSLRSRFGGDRVTQVALLLERYCDRREAWGNPDLDQAQRLTALGIVDPAAARRWLDAASATPAPAVSRSREWYVAMRERLDAQPPADLVLDAEIDAAAAALTAADPAPAIRTLGGLGLLPGADLDRIRRLLREALPSPEARRALDRIDGLSGHRAPEAIPASATDPAPPRRRNLRRPAILSAALTAIDDEPVLVTGGTDGRIRLWDPRTRHEQTALALDGGPVRALTVARRDGQPVLVSAHDDGRVRRTDLATGRQFPTLFAGDTRPILAVAVAPGGGRQVVFSAGSDGRVRGWDLRAGTLLEGARSGYGSWIGALAVVVADNRTRLVAGGGAGDLAVLEVANGITTAARMTGHRRAVWALAPAVLEGSPVVVSGGTDGTLRVWDVASRTQLGSPLHGHQGPVLSVGVLGTRGRQLVVSGDGGGTIRVWDLASGSPLGPPIADEDGGPVWALATTELDGRPVAMRVRGDLTLQVRDLTGHLPAATPTTATTLSPRATPAPPRNPVFPRPALPLPANALSSIDRTAALDAARSSPVEWARRRRAERDARRVEAANVRALTRLDRLGPNWHIVDVPVFNGEPGVTENAGFLAIGPGGVYSVMVVDHGRSRVLIAGDVVQINGKRPAYVAETRRAGRRVGRALSAAVGLTVPVTPVLVFVGSGVISVHGLPKDCLISTQRELDQMLIAGGARISAATASKLSAVANHPATWERPR